MGIQLSDWVENIVGKGEIARYEQFLLFQQCFQNKYVWSKGLTFKAYKLFEDSDADLPWLLFLKKLTCRSHYFSLREFLSLCLLALSKTILPTVYL